jgi:hypothetical protein
MALKKDVSDDELQDYDRYKEDGERPSQQRPGQQGFYRGTCHETER